MSTASDILLTDFGAGSKPWTQFQAIQLARRVEQVAPKFGYHVALTGGCLYRDGVRKDCDLLFYRIRQCEEPDGRGLLRALAETCQIHNDGKPGWCVKSVMGDQVLDLLFPEAPGEDY